MAPKARQAKGKARLAAYDKLQQEAEAAERGPDRLEITIPVGRRLGDTVIEVDGLRKGFGDRLLIEELSFSLPRAGIVGIIGPNGAGKTTLFKMLTGEEPARRRHVCTSATTGASSGYVDQCRDTLDRRRHGLRGDLTAESSFIKVGNREIHGTCRTCASFNFKGSRSAEARRRLCRAVSATASTSPRGPQVLAETCCCASSRPNDLDVDTIACVWRHRPRELPRLRRRDQPRSLVPRPHRHSLCWRSRATARCAWFEGNCHHGVRGVATQGARLQRRSAAPDQVQAAGPVEARPHGDPTHHPSVHRGVRVRHRRA
jgi:energy-coupling factor transporter ATP-binding protein EcfA2